MIERGAIFPLCLFIPGSAVKLNCDRLDTDMQRREEKRKRTRRDIGKICKLSCQQHKSHADHPTDWHKRPIKPVTYFTTISSSKSDIIDPSIHSQKVSKLKKWYWTWLQLKLWHCGQNWQSFCGQIAKFNFHLNRPLTGLLSCACECEEESRRVRDDTKVLQSGCLTTCARPTPTGMEIAATSGRDVNQEQG